MNCMKCMICKKTLDKPVIMPCGCTICKKHEIHERVYCERVYCPKCQVENQIPEKGFFSNSLAVDLLVSKIEEVDLGARHKVASESLSDLKVLIEELKLFQDPELEINRIIGELKNNIDLEREIGKMKIDNEALKLIDELIECENNYKKYNRNLLTEETRNLINCIEGKVINWEKELNTFKKNTNGCKEIHYGVVSDYKILLKELQKIRWFIFGDKLEELQLSRKKFCKQESEIL